MGARCLFGHVCGEGTLNGGLLLGRCDRCGHDVVAAPGGRWHEVPPGLAIVWAAGGGHAAPAEQLLAIVRRRAPALHKLRRRPRGMPDHRIMVSLSPAMPSDAAGRGEQRLEAVSLDEAGPLATGIGAIR